jgi:outer membrane usher protein FimD/PapC
VGQAGQALLRGVDLAGKLAVRWHDEDGSARSCEAAYSLPARQKGKAATYTPFDVSCRSKAFPDAEGSGT